MLVGAALLLFGAAATAADTVSAGPSPRALLRAYADSLATRFLPKVQRALARIGSAERRLLAMKYYLNRTDSAIEAKWAWDAAEIAAFRRSAEYGLARAELRRVRESFAERNPGYSLDVGMEIRTLGEQIGKWNAVRSIGAAARELNAACLAWFAGDAMPARDTAGAPADTLGATSAEPVAPPTFQPADTAITDDGLKRFIAYLRAFEPATQPTVAVPGLSQHGRLRAFDFRILRGGRLVAGTSTATIASRWDAAGWTQRLREAVCLVSDRFEGPLEEPYEPWHYTFIADPHFSAALTNSGR